MSSNRCCSMHSLDRYLPRVICWVCARVAIAGSLSQCGASRCTLFFTFATLRPFTRIARGARGAIVRWYGSHAKDDVPVSYGGVLGVAPRGVPAFSNEDDLHYSGEDATTPSGFSTGCRWQCVEFARRWLLMAKGVLLPSVPMAANLWQLQTLRQFTSSMHMPIAHFANGRTGEAPQLGDVLIWERSASMPFGHVAIVAGVADGAVYVAEQNYKFTAWRGADHSRIIRWAVDPSTQCVLLEDHDDEVVVGWMRVDCPFLDDHALEVADRFRHILGPGRITCSSSPKTLTCGDCGYVLNYDLWQQLRIGTEAANRVALEFVRQVICDESPDGARRLEQDFAVPACLHSALRRSLELPAILSRLEWQAERGVLVPRGLEADAPRGVADVVAVPPAAAGPGVWAGIGLRAKLAQSWRALAERVPDRLVHILVDDDPTSRTVGHAMAGCVEAGGLRARLCVWPHGLRRHTNGAVVDEDDAVVRFVWKHTAWRDLVNADAGDSSSRVALRDALLHPEVCVVEPMWKLIADHPATLAAITESCAAFPVDTTALTERSPRLLAWSVGREFSAASATACDTQNEFTPLRVARW